MLLHLLRFVFGNPHSAAYICIFRNIIRREVHNVELIYSPALMEWLPTSTPEKTVECGFCREVRP